MTDAQYRASLVHSALLNERYGLPNVLKPTEIARLYGTGRVTTPAIPTTPPVGDAFDWGDATICAAFIVALALMGVAGVILVNGHGHMPHPRH